MYVITALPVLHSTLVTQSMIPTIFILLIVLNSGLPIGIGRPLTSTISHSYMITISPQYMVWFLLPFGWGLRGRRKSLGMWVYSSIQAWSNLNIISKTVWILFHMIIPLNNYLLLSIHFILKGRSGGGEVRSELDSRADNVQTISRH